MDVSQLSVFVKTLRRNSAILTTSILKKYADQEVGDTLQTHPVTHLDDIHIIRR